MERKEKESSQMIEKVMRPKNPGISIPDFKEALKESLRLTFEFSNQKTAYDINNGYCGIFADYVLYIFSKSEDIVPHWVDKPAPHAFLEYEGRYYDAECLDGVKRWQDLPIFISF